MFQALLVFSVATVFVYFAAAARARLIPAGARHGPAHGSACRDRLVWRFRNQIDNFAASRNDEFPCGGAALVHDVFPGVLGYLREWFPDKRIEARILTAYGQVGQTHSDFRVAKTLMPRHRSCIGD